MNHPGSNQGWRSAIAASKAPLPWHAQAMCGFWSMALPAARHAWNGNGTRRDKARIVHPLALAICNGRE
jgi:hypothetical protein